MRRPIDPGLASLIACFEYGEVPAQLRLGRDAPEPDPGTPFEIYGRISIGAGEDASQADVVIRCRQPITWFFRSWNYSRNETRLVRLHDEHRAAWECCAPLGRLQFYSGRVRRPPVRLAWKLLQAHEEAWGSTDDFSLIVRGGARCAELIAGGHGILTRVAPVPLLDRYAEVLRAEGVKAWVIDLQPAPWPNLCPGGWPQTLEVGPIQIVGEEFEAEGVGIDLLEEARFEALASRLQEHFFIPDPARDPRSMLGERGPNDDEVRWVAPDDDMPF